MKTEVHLPEVLALAAKMEGGITDDNARAAMLKLGLPPGPFRREKRADGIWLVSSGRKVGNTDAELTNPKSNP